MVKSIKHVSTAIIDQIFVSGGNFLTIVICANILSLNEMGKVGYGYVIYLALLLINIAGIYQPGVINLHKKSNKSKYIGFLAWLQVIYAITLSVLGILLLLFFGENFDWLASYDELLSVFLFLLFLPFAEFGRRIFYILDLPKFSAGISAIQYVPRILLIIIFNPSNAETVFLIHAFCALIPTIVIVVTIVRNSKVIYLFKEFFREHISQNYPLVITAALGWATFSAPMLILGVLVGKESVAILMSIRSITSAANVLLELLETIVPTKFIKSLVNGGLEELKKRSGRLLGYGLGIWIAGLVVFVLFSEDIISLLLGEKYIQPINNHRDQST